MLTRRHDADDVTRQARLLAIRLPARRVMRRCRRAAVRTYGGAACATRRAVAMPRYTARRAAPMTPPLRRALLRAFTYARYAARCFSLRARLRPMPIMLMAR